VDLRLDVGDLVSEVGISYHKWGAEVLRDPPQFNPWTNITAFHYSIICRIRVIVRVSYFRRCFNDGATVYPLIYCVFFSYTYVAYSYLIAFTSVMYTDLHLQVSRLYQSNNSHRIRHVPIDRRQTDAAQLLYQATQ